MGEAKLYNGPVNRCIYCGATGVTLGREHTLPKSLGGFGHFVLQGASCRACETATSKLEMHVSRELFNAVRAKHRLPTKHKNVRPVTLPLLVRNGKLQEVIDVALDNYPALVPLLVFAPPAYVDQRMYRAGIDVIGTTLSGPSVHALRDTLSVDGFTVTISYKAVDFARLIAKIAYGFAIIHFGPALIDTAYVSPAILNKIDDVGRWVGCIGHQPPAKTNNIHELRISIVNGDIHVYVRLFANYEAPEYCVVVAPVP